MMELTSMFWGMGIFAFLLTIVSVLSSVFLGLAVYNDAKSWNCDNAVMWGLLSGIIGFIPAIVYLVIRSDAKGKVKCPRCGNKLPVGMQFCPLCQTPIGLILAVNEAEELRLKNKAKNYLIFMIICIVLTIILSIAFMSFWITGMTGIISESLYY